MKERCVALPTALAVVFVQRSSCHQPGFTKATCMAFEGFPPVTWVIVPEPPLVTVPFDNWAPVVSPS